MGRKDSPFIYTKDASTPTKSVVATAIENLLYSQLAESRCTHDAWLYCDIQGGRIQWVAIVVRNARCEVRTRQYFVYCF